MAEKMKGVRYIERSGTRYWYAALGGRSPQYCGKGEKGRKLAVAARSNHVAKQYMNREIAAGIKSSFSHNIDLIIPIFGGF